MGKDTSSIQKLASKITGCIIWSSHYPQDRKVQCFVNHDQYEQGSSKLVSILYRLIQSMDKDFGDSGLPAHCHVNLDNCWRYSFISMLSYVLIVFLFYKIFNFMVYLVPKRGQMKLSHHDLDGP